MPATIQSILCTPDVERLRGFYSALFDATQTLRVPDDGPVFYLGLRIGDSDLGLVTEDTVRTGSARETGQRWAISFEVDDVDASLEQVESAGGRVLGPPNDMPWGQRVAHIEDPDGNAVNLTRTR